MLKRYFSEAVDDWNARLKNVEVNQPQKKEDKRKSIESRSSQNALSDVLEGVSISFEIPIPQSNPLLLFTDG